MSARVESVLTPSTSGYWFGPSVSAFAPRESIGLSGSLQPAMALSAAPAPAAPAPAGPASPLDRLVLLQPPPLDPDWVRYEKEARLPVPRIVEPPLERQPRYAEECRELSARMRAPGARDHHLSNGVAIRALSAPSTIDGHRIPVLAYSATVDAAAAADEPWVVVYIHGGGLAIGEADSEDLSCRRIIKEAQLPGQRPPLLYSIGYRLMPLNPAATCVADCLDAFRHLRAAHPHARMLLIGSSSGGELAALVAQAEAEREMETKASTPSIAGVVLRCPVTSDAFKGPDYIPANLRPLHTSASNIAFETSLLGPMLRKQPRDGLPRMPLEAPPAVLRRLPPHWIQLCTNDMLYSDGLCYAKALELSGVPVRVSVTKGWPHTFWLKTPWMDQALTAERVMLEGLSWLASD